MKPLLIACFSFIFLAPFSHPSGLTKNALLTCILESDNTKYKVGELPHFKVEIINQTGKDIYLIGSLDGSDMKWRMPYCYFTDEIVLLDLFECGTWFLRIKITSRDLDSSRILALEEKVLNQYDPTRFTETKAIKSKIRFYCCASTG